MGAGHSVVPGEELVRPVSSIPGSGAPSSGPSQAALQSSSSSGPRQQQDGVACALPASDDEPQECVRPRQCSVGRGESMEVLEVDDDDPDDEADGDQNCAEETETTSVTSAEQCHPPPMRKMSKPRSPFRIAVHVSVHPDAEEAVKEAVGQIKQVGRLGADPSFVVCYCTTFHDPAEVARTMGRELRGVPWMGATQSTGLLSPQGWQVRSLGLFAIYDPDGRYYVESVCLAGTTARTAGAKLAQKCFDSAPKDSGSPNALWLAAELGCEDGVLLGIADTIASKCKPLCAIGGGSSCNNSGFESGNQFCTGKVLTNHVVMAAMHCSANIYADYDNAFEKTQHSGVVTSAEGRVVKEIDGMPAASVYAQWSGLSDLPEGVVLNLVTTRPLGRLKTVDPNGTPQFLCLAPYERKGGSLVFLGEIPQGERLWQMKGDKSSIMRRLDDMAKSWMKTNETVHGMLMNWCLCYVLTMPEAFPEINKTMERHLGGRPWIGANMRGEEGTFCRTRGLFSYGNLMISSLSFIGRRRLTDELYQSEVQPPTGLVHFVAVEIPDITVLGNPEVTAANLDVLKAFVSAQAARSNGYVSDNKSMGRHVVAFQSGIDAVRFATVVRRNSLGLNWTKKVLESSQCSEMRNSIGMLVRRGPEIKITLHSGVAQCAMDPLSHRLAYSGDELESLKSLSRVNAAGHVVISAKMLKEVEESLGSFTGSSLGISEYFRGTRCIAWSNQHVLDPQELLVVLDATK
eukprot:m51a1_g1142 hypothetical protein (743) ;mRNA; f:257419-260039